MGKLAKLGLWIILPALTLVGCQRAPTTVGCQGQVTFDGKPLPEGMVVFEPLSTQQGQLREAVVTNGSFSLPAEQGLHSGSEYRVRIKGFRKTGRKYPAADPSVAFDEVEQYLPEKYNAKSQLMAKFSADEQENVFSFELVSNK